MTSKTYTLSSRVFLDKTTQCYNNIVVINQFPIGPLATITKRMQFPALSPFKSSSACCNQVNQCEYAIMSMNGNGGNMCVDEISNLFSFLRNNNYTIDTQLTNMISLGDIALNNQKIIAFITITF